MIGNVYMCSAGDERAYVLEKDRDLARYTMADECKVNFTKVRCKLVKKNAYNEFLGIIPEYQACSDYDLPRLSSY